MRFAVYIAGLLVLGVSAFGATLEKLTLDQMAPGSEFLEELYRGPDPKVPYVLIAGDTSKTPDSSQSEASPSSRAAGTACLRDMRTR